MPVCRLNGPTAVNHTGTKHTRGTKKDCLVDLLVLVDFVALVQEPSARESDFTLMRMWLHP